jgi:transposase
LLILRLHPIFTALFMREVAAIDYQQKYQELQVQHEALKAELHALKRLIFASRQERFLPTETPPSSEQLSLDITAAPLPVTAVSTVAKKMEYTKTAVTVQTTLEQKQHPVRMKLPEHLERHIITLEPSEDITGLIRIGEEVTEELDYEPGRLFVNRYVRPKYANSNGEGVLIAPVAERPLPKAIAGAGLLAQTIIDKYVDHLPLYRQQQRFARENITIPYATLTDWVHNTCRLTEPLYEALKKQVVQSDYLHADETPIKVLDKDKKGETHRGYYWVYHNSLEGLVLFDYQPGRGREGPKEMLQDFTGHLQTDGYSAYDFFKEDNSGITVLHCMAHARRKFYEALSNDKVRAEHALSQIGKLYDVERRAKEWSDEQRLALRKGEAVPVLESLGEWMKEQYLQVLPKSTIGKALGYSIERWKELMVYATDGKLNIDNPMDPVDNPVENSIRPVAVGRKNYLFAGSHQAAQRSAMLYSLMGTCKLHGINPFTWLKDVLIRIASHPISKISDLLPHHWKPLT